MNRGWRDGGAALRAALAVGFGLLAGAARAATIAVDSTADDVTTNGNCTLREAVIAANTNAAVDACAAGEAGPTVDRIQLAAGIYDLTLQLPGTDDTAQEGDLDVVGPVEIAGVGMFGTVIDGQAAERVVQVLWPGAYGINVTLSDLEVRNGQDLGGGGILNGARLTLQRCRVSDNASNNAGGGGIDHSSADGLYVYDSEISGNEVVNASGGGIAHGGAGASIYVERTTISGNSALAGGGIVATSPVYLKNVTISGNTATLSGGGLWLGSSFGSLARQATNSTITRNHAAGGSGAGIYFEGSGTQVSLGTTIVADNTGGANCTKAGTATMTSTGYNIESPANSCLLVHATDQVNVAADDLGLAPLADNGGWTRTHGLFAGSVAVDTLAAGCPAVDQRGEPRDDGACDVGALELQPGEDFQVVFGGGGEPAGFEDGTFGDWIVVNE
jgi:CSLREA domain-containing protein